MPCNLAKTAQTAATNPFTVAPTEQTSRPTPALAAPPVDNVPAPKAKVMEPSLRVLPWANFKADITYTIDDTQPSQIEHWPILRAMGLRMTLFANPSGNRQPGYDGVCSEVAAMGAEVGNHTWSHGHADLSDCKPAGPADEEISRVQNRLHYLAQILLVGELPTQGDLDEQAEVQAKSHFSDFDRCNGGHGSAGVLQS